MGKPVLLWEACYSLGKQQQQKTKQQQQHSVGCTESRDRHTAGRYCLFSSSVFATICLLNNLPNIRHFDDVVLNLRIHYYLLFFLLFFTSPSSCLSSSLLPSSFIIICLFFLHLTKTIFCRKRLCFLVSLCFVV